MADRTFLLKVVADIADMKSKLGAIDDKLESTKSKMSTFGKAIAGAVGTAAIIGFGKQVVDAASDQEQAVGALTSVFGTQAESMNRFGDTVAETMGLSRAEYSQTAATMGALLKNAGLPQVEMATSTQQLTGRASDLASMYGGTVPEAMDAMASALKGEFDPMEKFGVSLKQSAIDAKAQAMGLVDNTGKATDYGKKMAAIALIMEQSADAQGNFRKESDTVAGKTAILTAQFKDMQAEIGQKLLPVIVKLAGWLEKIVKFVADNQDWLLPLAAGITAVVLAMKGMQAIQTFMTLMKE